jgi:hypothetical protein
MTTIGYATLQIIPSLKGVSEAINKEVDGKTIEVAVAPKVDKTAAAKAGKDAGETIVKDATAAVSKGEIGKAVTNDIQSSVKKSNTGREIAKTLTADVKQSSPGREIAKVVVDGLAEGVKQGLPKGGVGETIVDGIADGVKQGIDNKGLGTQIVDSIGNVVKSGNIAGKIKDAVLPGITDIGTQLRTGASNWSRGIADALRGGDIQGATDSITRAVEGSTNVISNLGEAFGLKTDSFKSGSEKAVGYIGDIGGSLQEVVDKGGEVSGKISDAVGQFNQLSGAATLLSGKDFGKGTKFGDSLATLSAAAGPIGLTIAAADAIDQGLSKLNIAKFTEVPGSALWFLHQLNSDWSGIKELSTTLDHLKGPLGAAAANSAQAALDAARQQAADAANNAPTQRGNAVPGDTYRGPGRALGGMISGPGTGISDSILARVSNGEYVVNADATRKSLPLLEIINSGKLPGFAGGGLVAGDQQLRQIIMERFGISDIGGYRPADKYGEHSTGRALDVMVGNNKSKGDAVKDFALANASAIDLKWAIWRQHLYYPGGGGYDMPDRGSPTQNHMDHVHIFSGTGIVNGLRGALAGGPGAGIAAGVGAPGAARAGGPGAEDTSSADQTSASTSSSGGAGPLPSSISGLASFGLDSLGSGVGKTSSGSDLGMFGKAAGSAVSGQVSSALGVFGVNDSPGWLKAATQLVGGLKVGGHDPSGVSDGSIFNGANPLGSFGGGSAAPLSATSMATGTTPPDSVHGTRAGQQPGTGPTYIINARDTEDSFIRAQRLEKEKAAAKLDRF